MSFEGKNILVIYASIHKGNTEKIAKIIGDTLGAKNVSFQNVKREDIISADLVGFGSGVYLSKFHKGLINLVEGLPKMEKKKAFLFSTSGMRRNIILNRSHDHFKNILKQKNFEVLREFNCLGYDTYGPLKYIGGVNKGRPNEKDLDSAEKFARELIQEEKI